MFHNRWSQHLRPYMSVIHKCSPTLSSPNLTVSKPENLPKFWKLNANAELSHSQHAKKLTNHWGPQDQLQSKQERAHLHTSLKATRSGYRQHVPKKSQRVESNHHLQSNVSVDLADCHCPTLLLEEMNGTSGITDKGLAEPHLNHHIDHVYSSGRTLVSNK